MGDAPRPNEASMSPNASLAAVLILSLLDIGAVAVARPKTAASPPLIVTPDTTPVPEGLASPTRPVIMTAAATASPSVESKALTRARLCLRDQAPAAARAEASAKLAADLLLDNLCASEVEVASKYERNFAILARFASQSERSQAGLSPARVDEETGDIVNPPNGEVIGALRESEAATGEGRPSASLRRLAAEAILEVRSRPPVPRKAR